MDKNNGQEREKPPKPEEPEDDAGWLALLDEADPKEEIKVRKDKPLVIECGTFWRGKTGGFCREVTSVHRIVDKNRRVLKPVWEKTWTEIAPGIETRKIDKNRRAGNQQERREQAVRIHYQACPVHLCFLECDSYEDYDDFRYSSSRRHYYWKHYVGED